MSKIKDLADRAIAYAKDLYAREPARVNSYVLAALAAVGVPLTISGVSVAAVAGVVLLIVLGGEKTRSVVFAPKTVQAAIKAAKRKK
jgi:hypothetical protein